MFASHQRLQLPLSNVLAVSRPVTLPNGAGDAAKYTLLSLGARSHLGSTLKPTWIQMGWDVSVLHALSQRHPSCCCMNLSRPERSPSLSFLLC